MYANTTNLSLRKGKLSASIKKINRAVKAYTLTGKVSRAHASKTKFIKIGGVEVF